MASGGEVGAYNLCEVGCKDVGGCFARGCAWWLDSGPVDVVSGNFPGVISVSGAQRLDVLGRQLDHYHKYLCGI